MFKVDSLSTTRIQKMVFFIRFFIILLSLAFLTACGGSGGGKYSARAIAGFNDNFGLIQLKSNAGNSYILTQYPADMIETFDGDEDDGTVWESLPIVRNVSWAEVRETSFITNYITVNASEYRDISELSAIRYIRLSDGSLFSLQSGGDPYASAPQGSFRYRGNLLMFDRNRNFSRSSGTVTVNVDFSDKSFNLSGDTPTYTVSGAGYVDTDFGTLSSSNSTVRVSGVNKNASIKGSLHGTGAGGVSGVIYTSGSTPRYTGAFAGAKR